MKWAFVGASNIASEWMVGRRFALAARIFAR